MIKCMLCNEEFGMITPAHLKSAHDITPDDYRRMFSGAGFWSAGDRKTISDSLVRHFETSPVSEETKQIQSEKAMGNKSFTGRTHTERSKKETSATLIATYAAMSQEAKVERGKRISESLVGHVLSDETKRLIAEAHTGLTPTEETRQLMSRSATGNKSRAGYVNSEEMRHGASESMKEVWKDSEYVKRWAEGMKQATHRKPNFSELQLQCVLDKHFPGEWKYVGDDQVRFGTRNPDFINVNGKKLVIEMFGVYWHDPDLFPNRPSEDELIAHYKSYGLDCVVIWEYDVYDEEEVVERVSVL